MNDYFDWKGDYAQLNSTFPNCTFAPLIGLTCNFTDGAATLNSPYYKSILKAGGVPVLIPPYEDRNALLNTLEQLDGILFTGGADLNPLFVKEEPIRELGSVNMARDKQELLLARLAYDRQIPMLGICRGIQVLATALGGSVYQDIYAQTATKLKHSQQMGRNYSSHTISIEEESILHRIFKTEKMAVNSLHHQAVKEAGPHLKVTALASDGIIEAVESSEYKSIIGVQFHPEGYALNDNDEMLPLFKWLTGEAASFHAAKEIHKKVLSLDTHEDTPIMLCKGYQFDHRDPHMLVDLHKMTEGHLDTAIMVAYLAQGERDEAASLAATAKADRILNKIEETAARFCSYVDLAYTPAEAQALKKQGKHAIMLGIENGYAIGKDVGNVERFRRRGVVYMTLCHNGDNDICDSNRGNHEHNGVSEFGEKVIHEMNRTGMLVDLSHGGEKSFYDAVEISSQPIVCSHSCCRALCDHPRNLTDEQLKTLAHTGGVAQMTIYNGFLRTDGKATILDLIEHLNHAVNIMGVEHVGLGTDFDGDGGICGCADASELINFTRRLLKERYTEDEIRLIWGGNFFRVMDKVQKAGIDIGK